MADGWRIQTMHGQMASHAQLAQGWLDSRPSDLPYTPQPARALAEVYDRAGHPDQARRLRYTAARKVARQAPGWAKPWLYTYDALVGNGYYPLRTLGWLAIFLIVAGVLTTTSPDMFAPTDPAKAVAASTAAAAAPRPGQVPPDPDDISGATPCQDLGLYPCFNPLSYALQTVVPPAAAVQATSWQPTGWMLAAITALKASGWILVAPATTAARNHFFGYRVEHRHRPEPGGRRGRWPGFTVMSITVRNRSVTGRSTTSKSTARPRRKALNASSRCRSPGQRATPDTPGTPAVTVTLRLIVRRAPTGPGRLPSVGRVLTSVVGAAQPGAVGVRSVFQRAIQPWFSTEMASSQASITAAEPAGVPEGVARRCSSR